MTAVLAEQHDEWIEGHRCLGLDVITRSRTTLAANATEVTTESSVQTLTA